MLNLKREVAGCYWSKKDKKWHVRVSVNHKRLCLGCFNKKEDATRVYKRFKEETMMALECGLTLSEPFDIKNPYIGNNRAWDYYNNGGAY